MPRNYKKKNREKNYIDTDFQLALNAVANGSSVRSASAYHHVPYTTLYSHSNNLVLYERSGRPPIFNKEEELCLEQAAVALQNWGIPLTINEFMNLVQQYATTINKIDLFPSGAPGYDWFHSYLQRHPNLVLKKSTAITKKRADLTIDQINQWFNLLTKIIEENDLMHRPGQLFNCDESGLSDGISYSKVIIHRQSSYAYRIEGGTGGKLYTSVLFCGSATGLLLPPFVVYKGKRLYEEWCISGPQNTIYGNSENGWMNQNLFFQWFEKVFVEQTKDISRPLLLIVDGHGSHFSVDTLQLAIQKQIIIVCLPPNATHLLQPLDLVFFHPLKIEWKNILKGEYTKTKFKNIGKSKFPQLLNKLFETKAIKNKNNIIQSFKRAGIFPLDPSSVNVSRILKNNKSTTTSSTTTTTISSTTTTNTPSTITTTSSTTTTNTPSTITNTPSTTTTNTPSTTTTNTPSTITTNTINNDSINNSFTSVNFIPTNNNHHYNNNDPPNVNMPRSSHNTDIVPLSTSYRQAISALEDALQNSVVSYSSINDDDDDNDDDEDYVPPKSILNSSITQSSSNNQVSKSKKTSESENDRLTSSRKSDKRKRVSWDFSSTDSTEEDDSTLNLSSQSYKFKKTSLVKKNPSISSNRSSQQQQVSLSTISFDSSDIDDDITLNQTSSKSQQAVKAITDTLQIVFGPSSKRSPKKAKQRTVLKKSGGQIMTENDVLEQMKAVNSKTKSKRSRSASQRSNATKRQKNQENAAFAPTQTNLTVLQQSNQTQSYFHQPTQNQSLSTNLLFNNNSYNSFPHSLFHSVPGASQSSIICSQCRTIPTVPV
ncbi:unnamed protein product, partial [Adineta steineri]